MSGRCEPAHAATAERGSRDKSVPEKVEVGIRPRGRGGCRFAPGRCVPYRFPVRAIRRFTVRPVMPESLRPLEELVHQPAVVAGTPRPRTCSRPSTPTPGQPATTTRCASSARSRPPGCRRSRQDKKFIKRLELAKADLDEYMTGDRWYQTLADAPAAIGYFSPEFGITAVLPQYSGGLGILAGDHLKSASDLGVPILGVGLLYRHGYFRQLLSREGWQQERYPIVDPDELPLTLLREVDGSPAKIEVGVPGGLQLRRPRLGGAGRPRAAAADGLRHRGQPGGPARRHRPARTAAGPTTGCCRSCCSASAASGRSARSARSPAHPAPEVFHTNEGHAGFLGVERIREFIETDGLDFAAARGEGARRHGVHHAHAGARRHRPLPARADRDAVRRRERRLPVCRSRTSSRSAPRTTRAATRPSSTWP